MSQRWNRKSSSNLTIRRVFRAGGGCCEASEFWLLVRYSAGFLRLFNQPTFPDLVAGGWPTFSLPRGGLSTSVGEVMEKEKEEVERWEIRKKDIKKIYLKKNIEEIKRRSLCRRTAWDGAGGHWNKLNFGYSRYPQNLPFSYPISSLVNPLVLPPYFWPDKKKDSTYSSFFSLPPFLSKTFYSTPLKTIAIF